MDSVIYNCSYTQIGLGFSSLSGTSTSAIVVADFTNYYLIKSAVSSLPPMDVKYNCSANGYLKCSSPTITTT
jgi:hypothetical protein